MTIDQNTIIALSLIASILMIVLLIAIVFVVFYYLKKRNDSESLQPQNTNKPVQNNRISETIVEELMCHFHEKEPSVASCAICERTVCESCHKEYDKVHLCPEHFNLYGKYNWVAITNERTTPDTPEKGHFIYHFKNDLWKRESVPTYIQYHYKIDIEKDNIESYVRLYVREEDEKNLIEKFNMLKNKTAQ